eukprot:COSAG06_NODE_34_length_31045_cov_28.806469_15_plen_125_part_00
MTSSVRGVHCYVPTQGGGGGGKKVLCALSWCRVCLTRYVTLRCAALGCVALAAGKVKPDPVTSMQQRMDQLEEKLEQQFAGTNSVRKKPSKLPATCTSQPVSHVMFARAKRVGRVLSIRFEFNC